MCVDIHKDVQILVHLFGYWTKYWSKCLDISPGVQILVQVPGSPEIPHLYLMPSVAKSAHV